MNALILRYFGPNYGIFVPHSETLVMNEMAHIYRIILGITVHS